MPITRNDYDAVQITPEMRARYSPRLRVLRQKRKRLLVELQQLINEAKIETEMVLVQDIGKILAPLGTKKKQRSIMTCVQHGINRGNIIRHAYKSINGRRRLFVHLEDAKFYAVTMNYSDRRMMSKHRIPLEEMKRKKASL